MSLELPYARRLHRPVQSPSEELLIPAGQWCKIRFGKHGDKPEFTTNGRTWSNITLEANPRKCAGLEISGVSCQLGKAKFIIVLSKGDNDVFGARSLFSSGALGHRRITPTGYGMGLPCTASSKSVPGYTVSKVIKLRRTGRMIGWEDPIPPPRHLFITAKGGPDVYDVWDGEGKHLGLAAIPSYGDSVRMNKVFRRIRENDELDLQEESDADDDFESDDPTKFLVVRTPIEFVCTWRSREKKWYPKTLV